MYYKINKIPFRLKSIIKIDDIRLYLEDKEHIDKVILLGGDGTINHFVNSVAEYDIRQEIYLKSNGTGNDFLRSLKSNDDKPQHIMKAEYDNGVSKYFINGVGMGVDGLVAVLMDKTTKKGKFSYMFHTLKGLMKYIPEPAEVIVDGKVHQFQRVFLVTVNNGRYFGGGMQITPEADISTEELDVIVCHTISKLFILPVFFTIYLGLHTKLTKYVTHLKGKEIKVTYTTPQNSQADGENTLDVISMNVKSSGRKIHLRYFDNKKR